MDWQQYKRESTLEDVYNDLYKNRPINKNCKPFKEWDYLESLLYEELLIEDERPRECEQLIDLAIDFMKKQKERKLKRLKKKLTNKNLSFIILSTERELRRDWRFENYGKTKI